MNIIEEIIKCFKQYKICLTKYEAGKFYEENKDLFLADLKMESIEYEFLKNKNFSVKSLEAAKKAYLKQVNDFFENLEKKYKDSEINKVSLSTSSYVTNLSFQIEGVLSQKDEVKVFYIIRDFIKKEPVIVYENNKIFLKINNFELFVDLSSYEKKSNIGVILRKLKNKKTLIDSWTYLNQL